MELNLRALGNTRDIGAAAVSLATGNRDIWPGPTSARSRAAAGNNNIVSRVGHSAGTGDVLDNEAGDWNASAGRALEIATVVVLLDKCAVPDRGCQQLYQVGPQEWGSW